MSYAASMSMHAQRAARELLALCMWWFNEIHQAWLDLLGRVSAERARRFMVRLNPAGGRITQIGGEQTVVLKDFVATGPLGIPPLQSFWSDGAPARGHAMVSLPDTAVLLRHLHLPALSEREAAAAIELQLERELPLSREAFYTSWDMQRRAVDRSWDVTIAIAHRRDIDSVYEAITAWGWQVQAVGPGENDAKVGFNLLPVRARTFDLSFGRRERLLGWGAAALLALCIVTVLGQWSYERLSLADELENARSRLAVLQRREAELEKLSAPVIALRTLMNDKSAVDALTAMSSVIPQDTWIYQSQVQAAASTPLQIRIEAFTPSASALAKQIQASPQWQQVKILQASAVGTGQERVELALQLAGDSQ